MIKCKFIEKCGKRVLNILCSALKGLLTARHDFKGILKVNVVPTHFSDTKLSSPFIRFAMRLQIARPKPAPL
jgi:hypothetical protein